jgi:hypothetical protein
MALLKLAHFVKTVTAAGTAEALTSTDLRPAEVVISAESSNTGAMYVGDSTVSSSTYAKQLAPGESFILTSGDSYDGASGWKLTSIFVDSAVNGDGVSVGYSTNN